jgi:NAD+ synthase
MKRGFKTRIFVGRLQPFHKGQLEAIKWNLSQGGRLVIVIGSMQEYSTADNPLGFKERKTMVKACLDQEGIKNYRLVGLPDFKNDARWAKKLLEISGVRIEDAVVSSLNSWTEKVCKSAGISVVRHPVFLNGLSATSIRKNIGTGKPWRHLVPESVFGYLKDSGGDRKIKALCRLPELKISEFIKEKVKEAGAKGAVVGVSGGIDSASVATLAKKALGKNIVYVSLPSAEQDVFESNVAALAKKLKVSIFRKPIEGTFNAMTKGLPEGDRKSYGNVHSRIRMSILYYFANVRNYLVLGTTNRSEMELGYFTKFGDGGVDIEPIAGLYKTELEQMAERIGVPRIILDAAPTAGLWPGQTDEGEIGLSYFFLDTIFKLRDQGFGRQEISRLTDIPQGTIEKIEARRRANLHKLSLPPFCKLK